MDKIDAVPPVMRGKWVELIRWRFDVSRDEWTSETAAGVYEGRDLEHWFVIVDGDEQRFPRSVWQVVLP